MGDTRWVGLDAEWQRRVGRVRGALSDWRANIRVPQTPEPGSSIAADDRVFPSMPLSQLAWWAITVGVEHLDATVRLVDEQMKQGGPLLPAANFTVLRGALVGASQAAVLLLPPSREERTTLALKIAHEEFEQVRKFREFTLHHPGLVPEARANAEGKDYTTRYIESRDSVRKLLGARGIGKEGRRLTDTDMIARASELVHERDPDGKMLELGVGMEWRMASGSAHGRLLMALQRPGSHLHEDGGRTALFGATPQEIAQPLVSVSLVLNAAWGAWESRMRSHL